MAIFSFKEPKQPSFLQKLFRTNPKENVVIEINNLFASKELKSITFEDIERITSKFKINLKKDYRSSILEIYSNFLSYCVEDRHLSDSEIADLKHLKSILNLSDKEIEQIHNEVIGSIYKGEVNKLISDGRLDESEKNFLRKLEDDLKLSKSLSDKIFKESSTELVKKFMDNAISDERLSPEEENELNAISKSLDVNVEMNEQTKSTLEKFKLYWQIENGNLPEVIVPINLQKSERCYFQTICKWYEERKVTKRIDYSGPTMRVKIMKGVYWRAGSIAAQRISEDVMTFIDGGTLYLTNKRIIFMGGKGNKTIKLDKVLDFEAFSNGIEIRKEAGKNPFLQIDNPDLFSMLLGRAITEL